MKVLLAQPNLWGAIGGGETVYRSLILNNPEIEFYLLADRQSGNTNLPANCNFIRMKPPKIIKAFEKEEMFSYGKRKSFANTSLNAHRHAALTLAHQIVNSIDGFTFDYIDVPEYVIVGDYLRSELDRQKVQFGRIVHFFHGSLSETLIFESKFSNKSDIYFDLQAIEKEQRESADFAIALNDWYPKLLKYSSKKTFIINALQMVKPDPRVKLEIDSQLMAPKLTVFGRFERRKGFDLVLEIARQTRSLISGVKILGPIHSNQILTNELYSMSVNRNVPVNIQEVTIASDVYNSMQDADILMIPSRFDSFNLIALEALSAGKLVAISDRCGIYYFLKSKYPEVYFIDINIKNIGLTAKSISNTLEHIESKAEKLKINQRLLSPVKVNDYFKILELNLGFSKSSRDNLTKIKFSYFKSVILFAYFRFLSRGYFLKTIKGWPRVYKKIRKFQVRQEIQVLLKNVVHSGKGFIPILSLTLIPLNKLFGKNGNLDVLSFIDRPQKFADLMNENSLNLTKRAVYAARVFRYLGYSNSFDTEPLKNVILQIDSSSIADVIERFRPEKALDVFSYLKSRQLKLLDPALESIVISSRNESQWPTAPKVSIIVSSFNAASKMEVFFDRLSCIPELRDGTAEILLIDANSPTSDLYKAEGFSLQYSLRFKGIQTKDRISIQQAWNLGIVNSKAEFLMFLGVDETIYSDSITQLLTKFDQDPSLDWVMGNSVVTNVDFEGDILHDVMIYKRDGATRIHPYLETCYVSYVGGMYKREIHSKFGYYDATFKGAGDTEFKSRVLPFLKVGYIQDTLGEFLNYPEDRTTASPLIELEDMRAWYVFRTQGGLLYQAEILGENHLHELLKGTSGYRKSYCGHNSIDLTLAKEIYSTLEFLGQLSLEDIKKKEILNKVLFCQEELFFSKARFSSIHKAIKLIKLLKNLRRYLGKNNWNLTETFEQYRHDNIFEQHNWFWE